MEVIPGSLRRRLSVTLLIISALVGCDKSLNLRSKTELLTDLRLTESQAMEKGKKYGAAILSDDVLYTVQFLSGSYHRREVYMLYIDSKADNFTNFSFTIYPDYMSLKTLDAATILPNGETIIVQPDAVKQTRLETEDGPDQELIEFSYPGVEPGSILYLKYAYSIGRELFPSWELSREYPMLSSKFSFFIPDYLTNAGFNVNSYAQGIILPNPAITSVRPAYSPAGSVVSYELRDLYPEPTETHSPPDDLIRKKVDFFYTYKGRTTWKDLIYSQGKEKTVNYDSLFHAGPNVNALIDSAGLRGISPAEAQIDSCYRFIQRLYPPLKRPSNFAGPIPPAAEYAASDSLKIRSLMRRMTKLLRKTKSDTTLLSPEKYGLYPLKILNVLTVSMLRELGHEAHLTYSKSLAKGLFYKPRVDFGEFTSSLIRVRTPQGRVYWLDHDLPYGSPRDIHFMDQGTQALIIQDKRKSLSFSKIPLNNHLKNRIQLQVEMNVQDDQSVSGTISAHLTNTTALDLQGRFYTMPDSLEKMDVIRSMLMIDASVKTDSLTIHEETPNEYIVRMRFTAPEALRKTGRYRVLSPSIQVPDERLSELTRKDRIQDVFFQYPHTFIHRISIRYPDNWTASPATNRDYAASSDIQIVGNVNHDTVAREVSIQSTLILKNRSIAPKGDKKLLDVISASTKYNQYKVRFTE